MSIYAQDVGEGRPVVLLAGFGLSHEVWDAQVRALSADHRVVCIDLRGTGRSGKPIDGYGIDRLARDVEVVLEQLDLREVTLVGWSFGGQVAFRIAASASKRLAQLVLIGSSGVRSSRSDRFPFGPPAENLEAALISGEAGRRIASRRETLRAGFHGSPDPDLLDWLLRCWLQTPSWAAVECFRTYLRTDLIDDLPAVTLPVLQLIGAEDPVASPDAASWLQQRLADGRLVELPECGHYPMFEAGERFDRELLAFVSEAR